jgi:fructokinase
MKKIVQYYSGKKYDEIGIASFGPVCLNRSSEAYGSITSTPKLKWTNFPLLN